MQFNASHHLVQDPHNQETSKHNTVQPIWVSGHKCIVGYETANQLAKLGSEYLFTGPELACCISAGAAKICQGLDKLRPYEHW
jgi:hypothetical protein